MNLFSVLSRPRNIQYNTPPRTNLRHQVNDVASPPQNTNASPPRSREGSVEQPDNLDVPRRSSLSMSMCLEGKITLFSSTRVLEYTPRPVVVVGNALINPANFSSPPCGASKNTCCLRRILCKLQGILARRRLFCQHAGKGLHCGFLHEVRRRGYQNVRVPLVRRPSR